MRSALADAWLSMRSAFTLAHLADGPVNQQALIDLLGVDPSALVAVLNELKGLGWCLGSATPPIAAGTSS